MPRKGPSEKQLCQRHGAGSVCVECLKATRGPPGWAKLLRQRNAMRLKEAPVDPEAF